MNEYVNVIGAGLAGCEAAWQLAEAGINVRLYEKGRNAPFRLVDDALRREGESISGRSTCS